MRMNAYYLRILVFCNFYCVLQHAMKILNQCRSKYFSYSARGVVITICIHCNNIMMYMFLLSCLYNRRAIRFGIFIGVAVY
jgi:hypothetical protein